MKILLIRPPFVDPRFGPPIGLAFISSVLKEQGYDVSIYDINLELKKNVPDRMDVYNRDFILPTCHPAVVHANEKIEEYCDIILSSQPDVVGFYLSYPTIEFGNELAKRISRFTRCIAGGPHAMYHQQRLFDHGNYDAIVVGYGEEGVLEAIKKDGIIRKPLNQNKEYIPDYSDCSLEDYHGILPIATTRGCPNQCNFCTANSPYYYHSIESVVKQFTEIPNIKRVTYNDSNINVNVKRTEDLFTCLSNLHHKPFGHIFGLEINANYEHYIPKMADAGVKEVRIGVESGSIRERKSMNKTPFNNSLVIDFIKRLTSHKIHTAVQFIFCYPDQSDDDRKETIDLIHEINEQCDNQYVKHVLNKFVVHHGTEDFFKNNYGVISHSPQNWKNSNYNPEKIKKIRDEIINLIPPNCNINL